MSKTPDHPDFPADAAGRHVELATLALLERLEEALGNDILKGRQIEDITFTSTIDPVTGEILVGASIGGITYAEDPERQRQLVAMLRRPDGRAEIAEIKDGKRGAWQLAPDDRN